MSDANRNEQEREPLRHLCGTYATSYLGYIYLKPPTTNPTGVPQIGAYEPDGTGFKQVSGYRLHTFAAYLYFHGDGHLHGAGYVNRGGYTPVFHDFIGTYDVAKDITTNPPAYTGKFTTVDAAGIKFEYYWVMSDNWRRLEFMTLHGTEFDTVVAGTLTRV
ncbi:MAG: hypothetical protein ABIP75_02610 [Pyrinomonadaceae bacterium]